MLLKVLQEHHFDSFQLAGEATSYYWLPLFIQFLKDETWSRFNPQLFLLNARWVHWYKLSKSPSHKTDKVDPNDIAQYLRERKPSIPWKYDPHWLSLRFHTRLRTHLVKSRTREKNYLNLFLFLTYSSYGNGKPFSNYLGPTSKKLLTQPELMQEFLDLPLDELADKLQDVSKHRLLDPRKNASILKNVLSDRYPMDTVMTKTIQDALDILINTIQCYDEQISHVEARIKELVQSDEYPEVAWLESVPGVGRVIACGVAAEIGGIARFTQLPRWDEKRKVWRARTSSEVADAVSKYAGLWWPKNSSGKFEADQLHLSREGNAYLRFYVLEAADRMRQFIPSFSSYYSKKYHQSSIHKHKRALVLTGTKCLDLFVALLRHQEFYRPKEGDKPLP